MPQQGPVPARRVCLVDPILACNSAGRYAAAGARGQARGTTNVCCSYICSNLKPLAAEPHRRSSSPWCEQPFLPCGRRCANAVVRRSLGLCVEGVQSTQPGG